MANLGRLAAAIFSLQGMITNRLALSRQHPDHLWQRRRHSRKMVFKTLRMKCLARRIKGPREKDLQQRAEMMTRNQWQEGTVRSWQK
mmetsp:Transcript_8309/g.30031  ORF Transcript_8309/g.30031 Transcript_8309/m.30031 type:complete len:87 (+) Transcript_8309:647-907(+)